MKIAGHFIFFSSENAEEAKSSATELSYLSLAGVFDMLLVAASVSVILLVIEWIVACFNEVDRTDPTRPFDFCSAIKVRYRRLTDDVSNWIPFLNRHIESPQIK